MIEDLLEFTYTNINILDLFDIQPYSGQIPDGIDLDSNEFICFTVNKE